jgi:MarR family transcriptional regulator, organic hydroperoxide resistance regulator
MDKIDSEIAKLFRDINHKIKFTMRKVFEERGITMSQGMVIGMLIEHGEMKISKLSKMLGLSNSTVSGVIDRLEKHSIVTRRRSDDDKRVVYVRLEDNFAKKHENVHRLTEKCLEKMLEKGTEEDKKKIVEGLRVMSKVLINCNDDISKNL